MSILGFIANMVPPKLDCNQEPAPDCIVVCVFWVKVLVTSPKERFRILLQPLTRDSVQ